MNKMRISISRQIYLEVKQKFNKYSHNNTRQQYLNNIKRFIKYCRDAYNSLNWTECCTHIQNYSDFLQEKQLSASTIHSYLAPVCIGAGVNMNVIKKPIRHTAEYFKGRENYSIVKSADLEDIEWSYLVEFQKRVGLRRAELKKLTGKDFVKDESGNWCVFTIGKGGKKQLQRISDLDIEFVRKYFTNKKSDDLIFEDKYFQNKLNLHYLRAECAKQFYIDTVYRLRTEPGYRDVLIDEIKNRWNKFNLNKNGNPKPFDERRISGYYYLRGQNRKLAKKLGGTSKYNRLALLATSIFKLSHWRLDVSVNNYLSINNGGIII